MQQTDSRDVRDFFDRQQQTNQYQSLKSMTRQLDEEAARLLNVEAVGDVLTIGGIWDFFSWSPALKSLTVLDLSPEMLKVYCPERAQGVVGDLYTHEFPAQSFDTVVFPLMLHHTPQGNWRSCEQRIEQAVARARRWLKPGGRVLILEYCPHPLWSPLQRAMLPVTRKFLESFGQPLVVMYTRAFYERVLAAEFESVQVTRVDPPGFNYWKMYPIFMGVRWLKMPLALYPKLHLFAARAGGASPRVSGP